MNIHINCLKYIADNYYTDRENSIDAELYLQRPFLALALYYVLLLKFNYTTVLLNLTKTNNKAEKKTMMLTKMDCVLKLDI